MEAKWKESAEIRRESTYPLEYEERFHRNCASKKQRAEKKATKKEKMSSKEQWISYISEVYTRRRAKRKTELRMTKPPEVLRIRGISLRGDSGRRLRKKPAYYRREIDPRGLSRTDGYTDIVEGSWGGWNKKHR